LGRGGKEIPIQRRVHLFERLYARIVGGSLLRGGGLVTTLRG
jgi:hypothetical protein